MRRPRELYYINKLGNAVLRLHVQTAMDFSEGLAWVAPRIGTEPGWGCVDTKGTMVIPPKFDDPLDFKEGRAVVCLNGKYGFVDKSGRLVAKPRFAGQASYSEGLADVWVGDGPTYRIGYIDRSGNWALKPVYKWAEPFSEGRALVQTKNGTYCFIDKTGKVVITLGYGPQEYPEGEPGKWSFSNGLAIYWTTHLGIVEKEPGF